MAFQKVEGAQFTKVSLFQGIPTRGVSLNVITFPVGPKLGYIHVYVQLQMDDHCIHVCSEFSLL